jgi:hypothetical protein
MVSVCGDKQGRAGQGGQGRHPPTAGHFQLRLEKQQWWCLSVWAVPGIFFQSLPVPCGASLDVTSPDVTDSREKRNQGQSDFLRQKIW